MNEQNAKKIREIFGDEATQILEVLEADPDVSKLIEEIALERIWPRPGLELKEKSLITITSQAALGRWDQVERHMKGFLHMGGDVGKLKEVFIHLSIYCGFPTMVSGLEILKKVKENN